MTRFPDWLILLLVTLMAASPSACRDQSDAAGRTYHQRVATLAIQVQPSYRVQRRLTGTVIGKNNTRVGFELAGTITEMTVDEGNAIRQGEVIARLDTTLLKTERRQIKAQLAETRAQLELANANLDRQNRLAESGFAAAQTTDELKARRKSLKARLRRLKANLAGVETRFTKSTLRAPFNAVVTRRSQGVGSVVAAGTPVVQLLQQDHRQARVGVPPSLAQRLPVGSQQHLLVNGRDIEAQVLARGSDVDPVTRTLAIRLRLPESVDAASGTLVQLLLDRTIDKRGYWVPLSALTDGPRGLWNLYALQATDDGHYRIEAHSVRVAHTTDARAYIAADPGSMERIVRTGLHRLTPGQTVRPAEPAQDDAE